jgi:predicted LPLAT superfamily acyltransferase
MSQQAWDGTTYGSGGMHRWLIRLLRCLDVRILYVFSDIFVIPVCMIFRPGGRIIYRYFRRRHGLGRWKSVWKTYVNHCLFSQVVIDRFAMYAGKRFQVNIEGYDAFLRLSERPEGFVQLSAHVGNYELAGYSLRAESKMMNALVYFGEKASVMENRHRMFSGNNIRMIAVKPDMSHLFEMDRALCDGEILSMPADRFSGSEKGLSFRFLDAEARFPMGPFSVATMRGLDVLAVNVMKTGTKRYTIFVLPLSYDKEAPRKEQIRQLGQAYVNELERVVRQFPEQWYNYYDFWNERN